MAALAFLAMLIEGAMADWSGLFMIEVSRSSAAVAATTYAAFALAMVIGRVFGDGIVGRLGARSVLRVGAATLAAAVTLAVLVPQQHLVRIAFNVGGFGLSNLVPVCSAPSRAKPARPHEGMATAVMGGYAGILFGPAIIGLAAHLAGLRLALVLLSLAAAALAIMVQRAVGPKDG